MSAGLDTEKRVSAGINMEERVSAGLDTEERVSAGLDTEERGECVSLNAEELLTAESGIDTFS